ncbi:hypothetical protein Bealeia1_01468 [Candidatus Bealeia paramacronuclearis]|uniref:Uncharacterized protein n=1 Tax=Candidatus Bealeia paramacronuclearis TaxID=1921001 RepID=A0ABZ2C485_9PROT|nr:hypothetical protein [Candidatus Bealeia paramacronuclearis]
MLKYSSKMYVFKFCVKGVSIMFLNLFFSFFVMFGLIIQPLGAMEITSSDNEKENQENMTKRKFDIYEREISQDNSNIQKKFKTEKKTVRFSEKTINGDFIQSPSETLPQKMGTLDDVVQNYIPKENHSLKIIKGQPKLIPNESIQNKLKIKMVSLLSSTIKDETWEWGFNVLARFWGLETEAYKMSLDVKDETILSYIDCGLKAILEDADGYDEFFDDHFKHIRKNAYNEWKNASIESLTDSKSRKTFTLSKDVFNQYGITRTSYDKSLTREEKEKNTAEFLKKKKEILKKKSDAYFKRYDKRHKNARDLINFHFAPEIKSDSESESDSDSDSDSVLAMNYKLVMSTSQFALKDSDGEIQPISDEDTFTTCDQRRLLLISLKMFLYRPVSWEEKSFFNDFFELFLKNNELKE